jgi:hypothetical protein
LAFVRPPPVATEAHVTSDERHRLAWRWYAHMTIAHLYLVLGERVEQRGNSWQRFRLVNNGREKD